MKGMVVVGKGFLETPSSMYPHGLHVGLLAIDAV
jgi:hypothetical protein